MDRQVVSAWYNHRNLPLLYDVLEDGDLLEFERQRYSHWAVYVGVRTLEGRNGLVPCIVHRMLLTDPNDLSNCELVFTEVSASVSAGQNIGSIVKESLEDFLGVSRVRINNQLDRTWTPFPPKEIIAHAESALAEEDPKKYSLMKNNCEHFVNLCRYGRNYSPQVVNVGTTSFCAVVTVAKLVRVVAPLIVSSNPVVVAAVAVAGVAATVIPLIVEAGKASRISSQPPQKMNGPSFEAGRDWKNAATEPRKR